MKFTSRDYRGRRERAGKLLLEAGYKALVVCPGTSFRYLTGAQVGASERLIALVLLPSSNPALISPKFEVERMRRSTGIDNISPWEEWDDPYEALGRIFREGGVSPSSTVALDPGIPFGFYSRIREAIPHVNFVDGGAILEEVRALKSPLEVACLRYAAEIVEQTLERALSWDWVGFSEREMAKRITDELAGRGGEGGGVVVQSGPTSALPHAHPGDRRVRPGDIVVIDAVASVSGYVADLTRTFAVGEGSPRARMIYEIVHRAKEEAASKIQPGVAAEAVDLSARSVIDGAGYGEFFTHRTGHGLGLDVHEPPYLVKGNNHPLKRGMAFTVEPGIYLPGRFGVRIEDDFVVGARGAIRLSKAPDRLLVVN
ncbi:MAG: M24 family metallopeptidase [bacterium]